MALLDRWAGGIAGWKLTETVAPACALVKVGSVKKCSKVWGEIVRGAWFSSDSERLFVNRRESGFRSASLSCEVPWLPTAAGCQGSTDVACPDCDSSVPSLPVFAIGSGAGALVQRAANRNGAGPTVVRYVRGPACPMHAAIAIASVARTRLAACSFVIIGSMRRLSANLKRPGARPNPTDSATAGLPFDKPSSTSRAADLYQAALSPSASI